jgi:hypothetical protein
MSDACLWLSEPPLVDQAHLEMHCPPNRMPSTPNAPPPPPHLRRDRWPPPGAPPPPPPAPAAPAAGHTRGGGRAAPAQPSRRWRPRCGAPHWTVHGRGRPRSRPAAGLVGERCGFGGVVVAGVGTETQGGKRVRGNHHGHVKVTPLKGCVLPPLAPGRCSKPHKTHTTTTSEPSYSPALC